MDQKLREFLFSKGILVNSGVSENAFAARFALASKFNISITDGRQALHQIPQR